MGSDQDAGGKGHGPGGLICPVVTPLHADGRVNGAAFAGHLERMAPHLDGAFVLGSCSEQPWLSDQAQDDVVRIAVETLGGRLPVLVGVGQIDLARTLHRVEQRGGSGADFLVTTPPSYFPLSDGEVVDFYTAVADASPVPVLLYNIPQYAGNAISAAAARTLADHPNIVGIKDSSGDFWLFQALLADRPAGFTVLQGREPLSAASVVLGSEGLVAGLLNVAAPLMRLVFDAASKGDNEAATQAQREVTALVGLTDHGGLIPGLKAAMDLIGIDAGVPLAPMRPAGDTDRAAIAVLIEHCRERGWLN